MATPYQEVFKVFLGKISDYSFVQYTDEELDEIFSEYLDGACVRFKVCDKDLGDRDNTTKQFNIILSSEEKQILGRAMVLEWIEPQIADTLLIKQQMTDRDFQITSQANHLQGLLSLRDTIHVEVQKMISSYSYNGLEDF